MLRARQTECVCTERERERERARERESERVFNYIFLFIFNWPGTFSTPIWSFLPIRKYCVSLSFHSTVSGEWLRNQIENDRNCSRANPHFKHLCMHERLLWKYTQQWLCLYRTTFDQRGWFCTAVVKTISNKLLVSSFIHLRGNYVSNYTNHLIPLLSTNFCQWQVK